MQNHDFGLRNSTLPKFRKGKEQAEQEEREREALEEGFV